MTIKQAILVALPIYATTFAVQEGAFVAKYSVNSELQVLLDKHEAEITHKLKHFKKVGNGKHGVWTFSWLPGYYVKYNLERIYGMERMQRVIDTYDLDLLTIPEKRIYHIKGRPPSLSNDNYLVIVKAASALKKRKPLNLKQVQQMMSLVKETGYLSLTISNYLQLKDDKITLIDTESTYNSKMIPKGLFRFIQCGNNYVDYTDEALAYIVDELNELIKTHSHFKFSKTRTISNRDAKKLIDTYFSNRH